jgi:putative transposase
MDAIDVEETLWIALDKSDITQVKVAHRPRLLSDNGPCFVSHALAKYLKGYRLTHARRTPFHPMTQVKIEHYRRWMKNVVRLETFYFPWDLEQATAAFVANYHGERYRESLDNLTPADVDLDRVEEMKDKRAEVRQKTMK